MKAEHTSSGRTPGIVVIVPLLPQQLTVPDGPESREKLVKRVRGENPKVLEGPEREEKLVKAISS